MFFHLFRKASFWNRILCLEFVVWSYFRSTILFKEFNRVSLTSCWEIKITCPSTQLQIVSYCGLSLQLRIICFQYPAKKKNKQHILSFLFSLCWATGQIFNKYLSILLWFPLRFLSKLSGFWLTWLNYEQHESYVQDWRLKIKMAIKSYSQRSATRASSY